MTSVDAGASFHYNFPSNYGDIHVGVYNGENYQRVEPNNQKGLELRATLRPFARNQPVLRGVRAHFVYYHDDYVSDARRNRLMGNLTYEHSYINAGFDFMNANDQLLPTAINQHGRGYSVWATPRKPFDNGSSWEALLRYDYWTPNTSPALAPAATSPITGVTALNDQKQKRMIVGAAYWFPHQGNVSTAILVDYDGQRFSNITTTPTKSVAVHGLLNF